MVDADCSFSSNVCNMHDSVCTCRFLLLPFTLWYEFGPRKDTGGCAGQEALAFNGLFNAALLTLFVQFYRCGSDIQCST